MNTVFDWPLAVLATVIATAPADGDDAARAAAALAPPVQIAVATASAMRHVSVSDERWLSIVHQAGAGAGLGGLEARVFATSSGRAYAPIEDERRRIIEHKRQPATVAAATLALAARNAAVIFAGIGRMPTLAELGAAHELGPASSVALIALADADPRASVASRLPAIAVQFPDLAFALKRARTAPEMLALAAAPTELALARTMASPPEVASRTGPDTWSAVVRTSARRASQ